MHLLNTWTTSLKTTYGNPKGASNKVDLIAAKVIQKYDIQQLDTISKNILKTEIRQFI